MFGAETDKTATSFSRETLARGVLNRVWVTAHEPGLGRMEWRKRFDRRVPVCVGRKDKMETR